MSEYDKLSQSELIKQAQEMEETIGNCVKEIKQLKTDLSTTDCIAETLKAQYKQLKAENEKLKEQLTMLDDEAVVVEITVEQFEEYKKLKKEIEKLKEEKQGLIKDWEEKKNLAYEIACKNEKLKETLAEIKDIAEEDCKQCFEIDGFSKPDDCGICPYNKILQKISECEVIDD